jgi:hypothetical protein
LESSTGGLVGGNAGFDKPFTQAFHLSAYHEQLIAITKKGILTNEAFSSGVRVTSERFGRFSFDQIKASIAKNWTGKFELVGAVENFGGTEISPKLKAFVGNPYNLPVARNGSGLDLQTRPGAARSTWTLLTHNCQHHAYAVLTDMGLR